MATTPEELAMEMFPPQNAPASTDSESVTSTVSTSKDFLQETVDESADVSVEDSDKKTPASDEKSDARKENGEEDSEKSAAEEDKQVALDKDGKEALEKGQDGRMSIDKRTAARLLDVKNKAKEVFGVETYAELFEKLDEVKNLKPIIDAGYTDAESVEELVGAANSWKEFIADFTGDTPESAVKAIEALNATSPESLARIAAVMPRVLSQVNPEAFGYIYNPIRNYVVNSQVEELYKEARKQMNAGFPGETEDQKAEREYYARLWASAGQHLEFKNTNKFKPIEEIFGQKDEPQKEEDPRLKRLAELEKEKQSQAEQQERANLDFLISKTLEKQVSQVDAYLASYKDKVNPKTLERWKSEVHKAIKADLEKVEPNKVRIIQNAINNAAKSNNLSQETVTTIVENHGRLVTESLRRIGLKLKKEFAEEAVTVNRSQIQRANEVGKQKTILPSSSNSGALSGQADIATLAKQAKSPEDLAARMFALRTN